MGQRAKQVAAAAEATSAVDPYAPVVICPQWLGCSWSPPISPAQVRRNIVRTALLGWRRRDEIHYTQGPLRMQGVVDKIFDRLPDETWVYPGHGDDTTLGAERPQLAEWLARGW